MIVVRCMIAMMNHNDYSKQLPMTDADYLHVETVTKTETAVKEA